MFHTKKAFGIENSNICWSKNNNREDVFQLCICFDDFLITMNIFFAYFFLLPKLIFVMNTRLVLLCLDWDLGLIERNYIN